MRIAILTSGILPVPAVQGGAVENLIDFYLEYNNAHKLHDITIYSIYNPLVDNHKARLSVVNHYHYININNLWGRLKRKIYSFTYKYRKIKCYNRFIDYYLDEVYKHIRKKNFDIIIFENRPSYALKFKNITNTKLICHLHNELLNEKTKNAHEIYNSLNKIITVSNFISESVKSLEPNDKKCTVVYNGIDLSVFTPFHIPAIKRKDIGIGNDDFILVFSGRINQEKGILELIRAINYLKDEPRIKLLVIGGSFFGNNLEDDNYIKQLKSYSSSIQDRIIFTGFVPYNKIPDYLILSDVAVIPSIWNDPFPTTVLEAQAMHIPIITTDRGGILEEVTKDNAIIVPVGYDFEKRLAQAIVYLFKDEDARKRKGKAPDEHIQRFNKRRFSEDFFKAIEIYAN